MGRFVGTGTSQAVWLLPQIQKRVDGIKTLAQIAKKYPQAAYAGLTYSLQQEWLYMQRVLDVGNVAFEPLEDALRTHFLPALLGKKTIMHDE